MRTFYGIPILLGTVFSLANAYCDDSVELSKIVVTPSRIEQSEEKTPYKVDVVTGSEMRQAYPEDVTEALETLPSVNINDYGSLGATKSIRMRGATASEVLVLMDGRPLNSPRDGEVDLSTVPLAQVGRVEVVYGPGSSLYGSSAMGGTVNIISREPPQKMKTEFTSLAGTFRTYI